MVSQTDNVHRYLPRHAYQEQTKCGMQALEAELVGIDSDLLNKLPPEVARQLSQRAIVTAAADTGSRGSAAVDLLRRTTSRNSAQNQLAPIAEQHAPEAEQGAGVLARNLSVNTSPNRRVSKTPSSVAGPTEGWRFTDDDVASQNNWQNQRDGEAPFKGLNYRGSPPTKPDPAGLKYATQESQREFRDLQEAGAEEQSMEWTVHQHTRPITDSEAAEMYNKSMDWKHKNALRYFYVASQQGHAYWLRHISSSSYSKTYCLSRCCLCECLLPSRHAALNWSVKMQYIMWMSMVQTANLQSQILSSLCNPQCLQHQELVGLSCLSLG